MVVILASTLRADSKEASLCYMTKKNKTKTKKPYGDWSGGSAIESIGYSRELGLSSQQLTATSNPAQGSDAEAQ